MGTPPATQPTNAASHRKAPGEVPWRRERSSRPHAAAASAIAIPSGDRDLPRRPAREPARARRPPCRPRLRPSDRRSVRRGRPEPVVCPVVKRPSAIAYHATDTAVTQHDQRGDRLDMRRARSSPQLLHEECDADVLVARESARGAEEAQRHHQPAGDVVGPLDRRREHVSIKDREQNDARGPRRAEAPPIASTASNSSASASRTAPREPGVAASRALAPFKRQTLVMRMMSMIGLASGCAPMKRRSAAPRAHGTAPCRRR